MPNVCIITDLSLGVPEGTDEAARQLGWARGGAIHLTRGPIPGRATSPDPDYVNFRQAAVALYLGRLNDPIPQRWITLLPHLDPMPLLIATVNPTELVPWYEEERWDTLHVVQHAIARNAAQWVANPTIYITGAPCNPEVDDYPVYSAAREWWLWMGRRLAAQLDDPSAPMPTSRRAIPRIITPTTIAHSATPLETR